MSTHRTGTSNHLPHFIEASTPTNLFKLIRRLQSRDSGEYKFINMYYDTANAKHVAWFYKLYNEDEQLTEAINELTKK